MPIHLPALTRRDLIKQGTAAGLSLLGAQAFAEEPSELWLMLSDTHISGDKTETARDINMADHLQQVVKAVLAMQEKERAFGLFVNGDLSLDHGDAEDYTTFVELMKPLREAGIDTHLTLGNHDDREAFWKGCEALTSNQKLQPLKHLGVITSALVNWVLLDSLQSTDLTPGSLGESQLAWLDRTLLGLPDKPTIILTHHNPKPSTVPEGKKTTWLTDTEGFISVVDRHAKVKAWFFGHTHNWQVTTKNSGLHQINLPPVAYVFDQARPSGWVTARVDAKGMSLELHALDTAHPEHAQRHRLEWS
jgi:3',5'-cyclic-AMP phosphodiesterase